MRASRLKRLASCLLVALACCATPAIAQDSLTVTVDAGTLQGGVHEGMHAWQGVPYAAPPVGDLRWRPPQPPAAWEGVRDATAFAPACPQPPVQGLNLPYSEGGEEDCLHLNVYAPATGGEQLPVMVWIHGGGLVVGGGKDPLYTPVNLVKNDVIVVTIDYRLGKLGYFAPQPLIDEAKANGEPVGNYGAMDQIAALQWVERNIAAFGGDPDNVTVFGESGGGRSVTWLMVSPAARGLFDRAIAESARANPLPGMTESRHGKPAQVDVDDKLAASLGATTMEELRALPAEKLEITPTEYQEGEFQGAFIDGEVFVGDPVPLFAEGRQAPVPFMIGTNSWDAGFFTLSPQPASLEAYLTSVGLDAAALAPLYADMPACLKVTEAEADAWYMGGVKMLAGSMEGVAPGYAYEFDYVTESLRDLYPGAQHEWEIPFVFGSLAQVQQVSELDVEGLTTCDMVSQAPVEMKSGEFTATYDPTVDKTSAEDIAMAERVSAAWANFARTGNPNPEGDATWPVYDEDQDVMMRFAPESGPVTDLDAARVDPQIEMMEQVFGIE